MWHFVVVIIDNNIKHSFNAQTDMEWSDIIDEVHSYIRKPRAEIQLGYCFGETGVMTYLADKSDWDKAMCQLQGRIKAARTCAVSMEIKHIVSSMHKLTTRKYSQFLQLKSTHANGTKARGPAKGKEKRRRQDNVPSEPDQEMKDQLDCLLELRNHLECVVHSKPGMKVFCWIDPLRNKRGHCDVSHQEMTLWAKQIVGTRISSEGGKRLTDLQSLGTATKYARPNAKKFDHPPTKKVRANPNPEVHVSVNIMPTPGAASSAMHATYLVSDPTTSAPGPLCPGNVSDIPSDTKPLSAPGPDRLSPTPRCARLLTALDCTQAGRIPSVNELLSLMDREDPTANPKYVDSRSELESLGSLHDAVDVYTMPVECLAMMGSLGREGARRLHEYCRDKLVPALGIMETKGCKSEDASIQEIPPPQVYVKQERQVIDAASIEEIPPPLQKQKSRTAACMIPTQRCWRRRKQGDHQ